MSFARPPTPAAAPLKPAQPPATAKPARSVETGMENFLNLMQRELINPLRDVADLAGRLLDLAPPDPDTTPPGGGQLHAALTDACRRSRTIARRLIDLADLLAGPPILTDERILVAQALRDAATDLPPSTRPHAVGVQLEDSEQNLAPVYGSHHWLVLSLQRLLALLREAGPPRSHVLIRLRQVGFHQVVTGNIQFDGKGAKALDLLQSATKSVRANLAAASSIEALDLTFARAVVELHGGGLRYELDGEGALTQFTLTLPTGEPHTARRSADCANCHHMRQAEQFAQDIGELLIQINSTQESLPDRSIS